MQPKQLRSFLLKFEELKQYWICKLIFLIVCVPQSAKRIFTHEFTAMKMNEFLPVRYLSSLFVGCDSNLL